MGLACLKIRSRQTTRYGGMFVGILLEIVWLCYTRGSYQADRKCWNPVNVDQQPSASANPVELIPGGAGKTTLHDYPKVC